jgi:hypothetical protein
MKTASTSVPTLHSPPGDPGLRHARTMSPLLTFLFAFGITFGASAQPAEAQSAVDGNQAKKNAVDGHVVEGDVLDGIALEAPLDAQATEGRALPATSAAEGSIPQPDVTVTSPDGTAGLRFAEWLKPLRVSLRHEGSYKFAPPTRLVNNRSSVQVEYAKLLAPSLYLRLDTKLNLHWPNDHRAKANDKDLFLELLPRETYLQGSFGKTSFRLGYQILPWGISEAGAITDEISPRNASEFFFVSLEESRIGQPMLTVDRFSHVGQWTGFFVPRPSYNRYPDRNSEYDIPGAFDAPQPKRRWDDPADYEYGLRWQRTFGKSDLSLMTASLIDNDYIVRKQRFSMYGLTANIAKENLLFRAEAALKTPKALFARSADGIGTTIVESDQFDASFGFDYSPGGRSLMYSAEVVLNHLLDWQHNTIGRVKDEYSLVGRVSDRFRHDDLSITWLTIYNQTYNSLQNKFLSSFRINDNSSVYFEVFYPYVRDRRSGSWPYRDEKQFVVRHQYQF